MRLFNSLILWGLYSLLIPQIASIPVSQFREIAQIDNETTLAPRTLRHDASLPSVSHGKSPPKACSFNGRKEETNGITKYVMEDDYGPVATLKLDHHMGDGSQGDVWSGTITYDMPGKVDNNMIGKPLPVAIKVSMGGGGVDQSVLQDQVQSPWVMQLREYFWSSNSKESVQVMDRGTTDLWKLMNQRVWHFNVEITVYGIGRALLSAHRVNIAYRDIKPENVLFNDKGKFWLIDWDLAVFAPERILTKGAGTVLYIGPEMYNRMPYDAFKNDVFGLTKLWLEMSQWKKMKKPEFNDKILDELRKRRQRRGGTPGLTYEETNGFLKSNFKDLNPEEISLMAHGLCLQDERWNLQPWMVEFRRLYNIQL
ncbi:hypothetical protein NUU61_008963 [Penicillium alfredii]|uniref:Protein kinase domain-containing protein n=1 Tax=Penicillium alfredii TaxID=1506179 RepID=A0A9W9EME9_9EURO|nr:uncharacterized protein NUU61_008963 [Penicillium alfredii]KAJ5084384.1 hypothetical protein NUU61_008963 [Penicillium alfredii]